MLATPPWVALGDVSKPGGSIQGFGADVTKTERKSFKRIIVFVMSVVVFLSIMLCIDMCLILLYATGTSDTFEALDLPPKSAGGRAAMGVSIALVVSYVMWVMSLACRSPANTPAANRKGVDEIWGAWLATRKAGKKLKKKLKKGDGDDEEHKEDEAAEQEQAGKQAEAGTARANGDSRSKNNAVHPFTAEKPARLVAD